MPAYTPPAAELLRIDEFNRTTTQFPDKLTLGELFEIQVEKYPERSALVCTPEQTFGTQTLSYRQLNAKINQLAHRLRAEGIGPGDVVALLMERSVAMTIGIFAILKAGGAYLPLSPENPADRIGYMLKDASVDVLLVQNTTAAVSEFTQQVINLDDLTVYSGPTSNPVRVNTPQDLAYVIYTSGSTGRPKGVLIEHRAVVNFLHWMQRAYPLGIDDVILQKSPYFFDASVLELFWWALGGSRVGILPPGAAGDPRLIIEAIGTLQVSVLQFVPSMLSVFLEYLDGKGAAAIARLRSVRRVFAGGEALAPGLVRRFNNSWGHHTGARLTNLYGPTEATVYASHYDCPTHNDFEIVPIGRPIDNTRLCIMLTDRQAGIGQSGELCIAGSGLARGYLNNPALTAEKFTDNPTRPHERIYRTGDIARWLADGNVEYLGRNDHQVKIRGFRIELSEIENSLREYPNVIDCIAVVKTYSDSLQLIVAYLVCNDGVEIDGLKAFLGSRLPGYMVPDHFQKIAHIPLTPSGKADRNALPEPTIPASRAAPATDNGLVTHGYVAPRSDLEIGLARACERVLGVERIGIMDNFFDFGADSLVMVTLTVEMERTSGLDINLGELFRSPTIAGLVQNLNTDAKRDASIVVALQPHGQDVPIFCIRGIDIYKDFARALGDSQPIFGVYVDDERALINDLLSGATRPISLDALVDSYCGAIARFRPHGPYRLAGLSLGGILAMALATKMRERGDQVELVFMFDTLLPGGRRRLWAKWLFRQIVKLIAVKRSSRRAEPSRSPNNIRGYQQSSDRQDAAFFAAWRRWQPRHPQADFPVILFRASDPVAVKQGYQFLQDYGWGTYLGERLVVVDVAGDHISHIKAPHVDELARQAQRFLGASLSASNH